MFGLLARVLMYGALREAPPDVVVRAIRDYYRAQSGTHEKAPNKEAVSKNQEIGKEVQLAA